MLGGIICMNGPRVLSTQDDAPLTTALAGTARQTYFQLLFQRNPQDAARARACYQDLLRTGIALGMPPYRLGIEYMDEIHPPPDSPSAQTRRILKEAFDPRDVIAPGRYARTLA
jgi:4-cresol dehydrogenase (hydroxylating) flavoprotein subunit